MALENHIGLVLQASSNTIEIFPRIVKYIVESTELGEPIGVLTPYGNGCIITGKYVKGKDNKTSIVLTARREADRAPYSKIVLDKGDSTQAVRLLFMDDRAKFEYIELPEDNADKVAWLVGCPTTYRYKDFDTFKTTYECWVLNYCTRLIEFNKFHFVVLLQKKDMKPVPGIGLYYIDGTPSKSEVIAACHHMMAELNISKAKTRWLISMLE